MEDVITRLFPTDPDSDSVLVYNADQARSTARTAAGRAVPDTHQHWRRLFNVSRAGQVVVAARLDRETVAELELGLMVEDIAAQGARQAARTTLYIEIQVGDQLVSGLFTRRNRM